jgi:hypothetical protein
MTGSILLSFIAEGKCTKLRINDHALRRMKILNLRWCEQLFKHKFPQCAPPNLETSCLLEIGDIPRKLRLRSGCQFPCCALALIVVPKYLNCATFWKHLLTIFVSWLCPAYIHILSFCVFTSRPTFLLGQLKFLCFSLWYLSWWILKWGSLALHVYIDPQFAKQN